MLFLLIVVYFVDPHTHRWFRIAARLAAALGVRQAGADHLSGVLHQPTHAGDGQQPLHHSARRPCARVLAAAVALPDLGTAIVLVADRRCGVLRGRTGMAIFVRRRLRRWSFSPASRSLRSLTGWRASSTSSIPTTRSSTRSIRAATIKSYINESETTRDASYQPRQSRIAVGSGGFLGLGLMQSKQKCCICRKPTPIIIYAVVGEELGFFGCTGGAGRLPDHSVARACGCTGPRRTTSAGIWRWA